MKVIFRDFRFFSIYDSVGIWFSLNTKGGLCNFGIVVDIEMNYSFEFSPGAYDYDSWLDEVCDMIVDAATVRIAKVRDDALCIVSTNSEGRREAHLHQSGECSIDDEVFTLIANEEVA